MAAVIINHTPGAMVRGCGIEKTGAVLVNEENMSKSSTGASSATYRKAVNGIASAVGQKPSHSKHPSEDFEAALESIPDALKEKALEWCIRGIKRGMAKATDLMAERTIYVQDGTVRAPATMEVKVRTKLHGVEWDRHTVEVQAKEIGFE